MSVTADALRTHIDFTAWASLRLLQAAGELPPEELTRDFGTADKSILGTLAHIFAGDRIWLSRFVGGPPSDFLSDSGSDYITLAREWPAVLERWKNWAAALDDEQVRARLSYADLKGRPWNHPIWQLVLHVVNHDTHHRGQVSGFLRSLGHTPPPVDLIYYYRQQ